MALVLNSLVLVFCAIATVGIADECLPRPKPSENCTLPPDQQKYASCVLRTTEIERVSNQWCVCSIEEEARVYFDEEGLCADFSISRDLHDNRPPFRGSSYETQTDVDKYTCAMSCWDSFECTCFHHFHRGRTCHLFGASCTAGSGHRQHGGFTTGQGAGKLATQLTTGQRGNCGSHCPILGLRERPIPTVINNNGTPSAYQRQRLATLGKDSSLDGQELAALLNSMFKTEFDGLKVVSRNRARSLIALWDNENEGILNLEQSVKLMAEVRDLKKIFKIYDKDKSESLTQRELSEALHSKRLLNSGNMFLAKNIYGRYADDKYPDKRGQLYNIKLDGFFLLAAKLRKMNEIIREKDENKDGTVEMNYDEVLSIAMLY